MEEGREQWNGGGGREINSRNKSNRKMRENREKKRQKQETARGQGCGEGRRGPNQRRHVVHEKCRETATMRRE